MQAGMGNQLVYIESFGLVSLLFVDIYAKCLDLVTSVGVLKGVDLGGGLGFCIYLFVAQEWSYMRTWQLGEALSG